MIFLQVLNDGFTSPVITSDTTEEFRSWRRQEAHVELRGFETQLQKERPSQARVAPADLRALTSICV